MAIIEKTTEEAPPRNQSQDVGVGLKPVLQAHCSRPARLLIIKSNVWHITKTELTTSLCIQSNFNGSNTLGTMTISSRQG